MLIDDLQSPLKTGFRNNTPSNIEKFLDRTRALVIQLDPLPLEEDRHNDGQSTGSSLLSRIRVRIYDYKSQRQVPGEI